MTNIFLRKAIEADIPLIRQLAERIWWEHYPSIISDGVSKVTLGVKLGQISDDVLPQLPARVHDPLDNGGHLPGFFVLLFGGVPSGASGMLHLNLLLSHVFLQGLVQWIELGIFVHLDELLGHFVGYLQLHSS